VKIVFLDLDGVLNSHAYMASQNHADPHHERATSIKGLDGWVKMIDPKAVKLLNTLLEQTHAKIVISSSWRHAHPTKRMQAILDLAGMVGDVIDSTPLMTGPRGHEIASWLGAHPEVKAFVIFDDGSDAGEGGLTKWFIKTELAHGLQDEHVQRAIHLLGRR